MQHPLLRRLTVALVLCAAGLIGCPPPQQRWLAGSQLKPGMVSLPDEDVRAGRQRIADLRRDREAAGLGRDYRIGAGDLIRVTVYDLTELERTVRVSGTGSVMLPLVGTVKAEGLTERELEGEITRRLGDRYVKNPQVNIFVQDYGSQRVSVMGAVQKPGQFNLTRDKNTILDMISEAGGLARDAGGRIYLLPGERSDPTKLALLNTAGQLRASDASLAETISAGADPIVIDVRDMLDAGTQSALLLPARSGDVIVVPEGGQFLVDGWVEKPGAYSLSRGATVLGAITAAGGPLYPAATGGVQVVRTQRTGVRTVIRADISEIIEGKGQDIPLEGGDIVYVPASLPKLPLYAIYTFVTNVFRIAGTVPII